MKIKMIIPTAAICIMALAALGDGGVILINGPATPASSTFGVGGASEQWGVFPAASTNYFNLATSIGQQPNTNLWPSVGFLLSGAPTTNGLPTSASGATLSGDWSMTTFLLSVPLRNSNAVANSLNVKWAMTLDGGNYWFTNYYNQSVSPNVNSNYCLPNIVFTNFPVQGLAIEEVDVTFTNSYATNVLLEEFGKGGF